MDRRPANAPAKRISATEAAALVRPGMWLDLGGLSAQPELFDQALAARVDELSDVKIRSCLSVRPLASIEADPEGKHLEYYNWHFSGYDRAKHDAGRWPT